MMWKVFAFAGMILCFATFFSVLYGIESEVKEKGGKLRLWIVGLMMLFFVLAVVCAMAHAAPLPKPIPYVPYVNGMETGVGFPERANLIADKMPLPTPSAHADPLHVRSWSITEYCLSIEFATATGALAETVRIQRKEGRLVITTEPAPEEGDKLTGRLRPKDENSRFKEVFFPGYNLDSKPSEGQCPFCGGKVTSEITGCPEGKIGCTVAHFGLMCSKCGRILERLPEELTGTLTPGEVKRGGVGR